MRSASISLILEPGLVSSYLIKLGYSERAKKFEEIFHLKFDVTQ